MLTGHKAGVCLLTGQRSNVTLLKTGVSSPLAQAAIIYHCVCWLIVIAYVLVVYHMTVGALFTNLYVLSFEKLAS